MKSQLSRVALGLVAWVLLSPAHAERLDPVTMEQPIETDAGLISITGMNSGDISVRACATCGQLTYKYDARTTFAIGRKVVTQAVWMQRARAQAATPSVVFYRLSDKFISRVVVGG